MLLLLAVALAVGTAIASRQGSPSFALALAVVVISWLTATLIAAALIGLAAVVTWQRPAPAATAVAFLVGALVVFPMRAEYLGEAHGEEADCTGYVPLGQAFALDEDQDAALSFDWRCTNAALAHNPHILRTP
jgi:hypothetical protein